MGKLAEIHATAELGAGQPNPREFIGANNPPADPFDGFATHFDDLMMEARNFLDGEPIATEGQAAEVSRILDLLRKSSKDADAARAAEKKPHDDAAKAVQAKWAPLLTKASTAVDACKAALSKWLAEQERVKQAAAAESRRIAEEAAKAAALASQMTDPADLEGREQAEALVTAAKAAGKAATAAGKDKAHATGGSRAVGLRSFWTAEITDFREAARHYYATNPDAIRTLVQQLASADALAGKRQVPGIQFHEERRAV